jgi:SAM-dependent methyltransferase
MVRSPFDAMYESGEPPWEIGRPQPAIAQLFDLGRVHGKVIDLGCGTGDTTMLAADLGHDAVGIDASRIAIERAKAKALTHGSGARFMTGDALHLEKLGETFDTAIDSGLFHSLTDAGHEAYVASLATSMRVGGTLHVLCFSDEEPNWGGPRRVSEEMLRSVFSERFAIERIERARFESLLAKDGAHAWRVSIVYLGRVASTDN